MAKLKLHFQRFEFKYQLPLQIIEGMIPEFLKYMEFDPYTKNLPNHAYTVRSLYYDSTGLDCYWQKVDGQRTRKKLRIRFYQSDIDLKMPVFLEIKRKYNIVVVKDRLVMDLKQCQEILLENKIAANISDESQKSTLDEFLWLKTYNSMTPQVMVVYKRIPLISKVDPNFRVTIDHDLKTYQAKWLEESNQIREVIPDTAILEDYPTLQFRPATVLKILSFA